MGAITERSSSKSPPSYSSSTNNDKAINKGGLELLPSFLSSTESCTGFNFTTTRHFVEEWLAFMSKAGSILISKSHRD